MKTIAQLNSRTAQLCSSSKKLAENIHLHCVDIAEHFKEHGDTTAASLLIQALHSAVRKNALKNWFEAFSGMKYVAESKNKDGKIKPEHFIRNKDIPFEQIDLDAALETSPWDFTPEPVFKPFDLNAAIKALIKKAEKAGEDAEHQEAHVIPDDKLAALKALAA